MNLDQYLQSTDEAARRSRGTIVVLVAACVLSAAGFLNSFHLGWIHQRLEKVKDAKWVAAKLGYDDSEKFGDQEYVLKMHPEFTVTYQQFVTQIIREYADNALTIKVPFFGIAFDVNDLGLLAGFAFAVILTLLRYSLRSEIVAIQMAFDFADASDKLGEFYKLLATKQVFTIPHVASTQHTIERYRIAVYVPRVVIFLPAAVQLAIFANDYATRKIGAQVGATHADFCLCLTFCFLILIIALALSCWKSWRAIDRIWDGTWSKISPPPSDTQHYSV